jgi:beta-lactamase class D
MKRAWVWSLAVCSVGFATSAAEARNICTILASVRTGEIVLQEGDCLTRVTPASTFKIPLAAMGFDAGILQDAHHPVWPFKPGYADWGGPAWQQDNDPTSWMTHSVVWYSQQMARQLGVQGLTRYAQTFGYGNADFSGDPGKSNALERAWISSSLKISPREQVTFLRNLITGNLPIKPDAIRSTVSLLESVDAGDGWTAWGKTGSAFPRQADGNFDRAQGWGWYVGWVSRADVTYVFARLDQDESRNTTSGGIRARAAFVANWPELIATLP